MIDIEKKCYCEICTDPKCGCIQCGINRAFIALKQVFYIHRRVEVTGETCGNENCPECRLYKTGWCDECNVEHPCNTYNAINGANIAIT